MAKVIEVTEHELQERRSALLKRLEPVTYDELASSAEAGTLTEAEWDVWEELASISFLLNE